MKIVALGDIHGYQRWKRVFDQEKDFDLVVFIGDYFDSFHNRANDQIANFLDIIAFRDSMPDKVKLLIGNHDFSYYPGIETCSGYQKFFAPQIREVFFSNSNKLQVTFEHDNFTFVHAGISKTWMKNYELESADDINKNFISRPSIFKFNGYNPYGDDITQGPLWIRPSSLLADFWGTNFQIVGHTQMRNILFKDKCIFIDTMGEGLYLVIDEQQFKIKTVG